MVQPKYLIADRSNHRVQFRQVSVCDAVAGTGSAGSGASELGFPADIAQCADGDIPIADNSNQYIQQCPLSSRGSACVTVAGCVVRGKGPSELDDPSSIAIDAAGGLCHCRLEKSSSSTLPPASRGVASNTVVNATDLLPSSRIATDAADDHVVVNTTAVGLFSCVRLLQHPPKAHTVTHMILTDTCTAPDPVIRRGCNARFQSSGRSSTNQRVAVGASRC